MKSPVTSWHAIAAIGAMVLVGAAMHWLGVSDATTAVVMTLVSGTLTSMGLLHAADQQAVDEMTQKADTVVDTVKAVLVKPATTTTKPAVVVETTTTKEEQSQPKAQL
jgi:hypothetical protein